MAELQVVGHPVRRVDGLAKATGTAPFGRDLFLPGMLYARTLRCPLPHARVLTIDTSQAERLPGVEAVVTARDVRGSNCHGLAIQDQPVLVPEGGTARLLGDPIALVAACSEEVAEEAIALIEVAYQELEAVSDPEQAMAPDAPCLLEGHERNICGEYHFQRGDVIQGFAEADVIDERVYAVPRQEHAYLEAEAGIASIDGEGIITIYAGAQDPVYMRQAVAGALGLPENRLRIVAATTGGAFGAKTDVSIQAHLALLTLKTGRPVKLTWSREESFAQSTKRHPMRIRYRMGATREGKITAIEAHIVADAGAYTSCSPYVLQVTGHSLPGPYHIPNIKVDGYAACTNNPVSGAFRGYGEPQAVWATECELELLASQLGLDAAELRMRNALVQGMEPALHGVLLDSEVSLPETIARAQEAMGPLPAPSGPGKRVGRGMACAMPTFDIAGLPDGLSPVGASVELLTDGTAVVRSGVCEMGNGITTVLAQVAAEELGIAPERVSVLFGDSLHTPRTGVTAYSRMAYCAGNATRLAAGQVRARLLQVAADRLGVPAERLGLKQGYVWLDGERQALSVTELANACFWSGVDLVAREWFTTPRSGVGHTFITTMADVEVDEDTGQVLVLKMVSALDAGKALNPVIVRGQIIGGTVMALGYALLEDMPTKGGVLEAPSLAEYLLPTSLDAPDQLEAVIVENPYATGPYGARGVGEASTDNGAPAILNAIHEAVGVMICEGPATPERILRALRQESR